MTRSDDEHEAAPGRQGTGPVGDDTRGEPGAGGSDRPRLVISAGPVPDTDAGWTAAGADPEARPRTVISTDPTLGRVVSPYAVPAGDLPRRAKRGRLVALVGGAFALAAAGVVGVAVVAGGDSGGGAASPKAAVERFVAAVNDEDVLGVLDVMLPGERRTWGDPLRQAWDEARRLQLLGRDADLGDVRGIDLRLDVTVGDGQNVADDLVAVRVNGTVTGSIDVAGLPLGDLLTSRGLGRDTPAITGEPDSVDARIVTVERDGRWYVSLWYSVAEAARERIDQRWPAPERGVLPEGAATPQDAVKGMLTALRDLSLEGVLKRLNPEEAEVLQRVAPWFLRDAQAAIDAARKQSGLRVDISDLDLTARVSGDRARVFVGPASISVEAGGVRMSLEDGCLVVKNAGQPPLRQCPGRAPAAGDGADDGLASAGLGDLAEPMQALSRDLAAALADMADVGIEVRRVDGRWFTSPVGTVMSGMLAVMRALDRQEIETMVDDVAAIVAAYSSLLSASDDFGNWSPAPNDTSTGDPQLDSYFDCQNQLDFDAAVACVRQGLAAQAFPREMVAGAYLAPECAWKGAQYDPTVFELSDEAYVNLVTLSAACFDEKVAQGVLDEGQVPFELRDPACLKGKNPVRMSPSEAAAYFECIRP